MTDREHRGEGRDHGRREERGREEVNAPAQLESSFDAVTRIASTVGNRGFAHLARDGAGLLPSGRVHSDVEAVIDRTRGRGAPLDAETREKFGAALGDSLGDVRLHTDTTAGDLARSVDARAFTTGSDIYFARNEFRPGEATGAQLLAHELTHVVQQRGGPASGPLTVTQPGDSQESEAEAVAHDIAG